MRYAAKRNRCKAFGNKTTRFLDKYNKEQTSQVYVRLGLQRYGDFYLHSGFDKSRNISCEGIQYVKLFSIVAIFILLIACINFMNLETARSVKRAKEIGIRKVAGAMRLALVRQFMGEALLIVSTAVIFSLALVILVLPQFNQITGKEIHIPFKDAGFWLSLSALLLVTRFYFRKLSCNIFIIIQAGPHFKRLIKIFKQCFMVS